MLIVVCVGEESSSGVVKGVGEDPIGHVVGNGIADPLDMVGKLAFAACAIVLRV